MTRTIFSKVMWGGRTRALALGVATSAALAVCLLALVAAHPARAAFPGNNGKIAFQSVRDASGEIYTVNSSSGAATRITFPFGGNVEAAYSPDGSRIAFNRGGDIHVMSATGMKPDGTGSRRLTSAGGAESDPTWSPEGTRIAFLANTAALNGQTDPEIWVMNADGTGQRPLTANDTSERDPAWSPRGDKIAFVDERRAEPWLDTDSNVYVMDANGSNQTNITPNVSNPEDPYQSYDEDPAWSPDGNKIAYVHGRTGTGGDAQDIWTMTPSGTGKTNVTDDAELPGATTSDNLIPEFEPAWSPLGDKIAYSLKETTNQDIGVMDADGTDENAMDTGDDTRKDEKPDWQPVPVCTMTVNPNNDPLVGTAGKDVFCGDSRNDTINGAGGDDIVLALGGNDKLTGAQGNDTLNGGPGTTDTVLYSGTTTVKADLTTEFATGVGSDVLLGIENLGGSSANDRLTGSAVANALVGGGGADIMAGLGGNDALNSKDGVNGNDSLNGGPGTDTKTTDATEKSIVGFP